MEPSPPHHPEVVTPPLSDVSASDDDGCAESSPSSPSSSIVTATTTTTPRSCVQGRPSQRPRHVPKLRARRRPVRKPIGTFVPFAIPRTRKVAPSRREGLPIDATDVQARRVPCDGSAWDGFPHRSPLYVRRRPTETESAKKLLPLDVDFVRKRRAVLNANGEIEYREELFRAMEEVPEPPKPVTLLGTTSWCKSVKMKQQLKPLSLKSAASTTPFP